MNQRIQNARAWAGKTLTGGTILQILNPAAKCRYECNGVRVELTDDAVVVSELDDHVRPAQWVETKRTTFTEDILEAVRVFQWADTVSFHVLQFVALSNDEQGFHDEYFGDRRARISTARHRAANAASAESELLERIS